MKVSDLLEILEDYPKDNEVMIAIDPANPFISHIRGVVKPSSGSPIFLLEDYGSRPTQLDLWRMLDE